jgi:hypothetical protein
MMENHLQFPFRTSVPQHLAAENDVLKQHRQAVAVLQQAAGWANPSVGHDAP